MIEYSIGFLHTDNQVALVRKNRPQWQAGYLNGIGGHIEPGESPHDCVVREFEEETGVRIGPWEHFLTLEGPDARIYCYAIHDKDRQWIDDLKTVTDEEIELWWISELNTGKFYWGKPSVTVPNLSWIIPMMLQRDNYYATTVEFRDYA